MFSAPPNQHITMRGGGVFTFGLIKICSIFVTNTNTKHHYSKAKKRTPKTSQETQKHPKSTPVRPNCNGVLCFSPFKGLINRSKAKTTANDWKNPKHHYSKAKKRTPKTSQEIQKHPKSTPVRRNSNGVLCFLTFQSIKNRSKAKTTADSLNCLRINFYIYTRNILWSDGRGGDLWEHAKGSDPFGISFNSMRCLNKILWNVNSKSLEFKAMHIQHSELCLNKLLWNFNRLSRMRQKIRCATPVFVASLPDVNLKACRPCRRPQALAINRNKSQ